MTDSLGFVQHAVHRTLLQDILREAERDPEVVGVMVYGSVARREALPLSDLDVYVLLADGCVREFQAQVRAGVLTEIKYADRAQAIRRLDTNDMEAYCLLEGRVLLDPKGHFGDLKALAQQHLLRYEPPIALKRETAHWLVSARTKIAACLEAGDLFRAVYVTSVTSWKILEGVWLANGKPIPPAGGVWAHLGDLAERPAEGWLRDLFMSDGAARATSAVQLIDWILPRLQGAVPTGKAP